jgi:hypothetical protein
MPRLLGAMHPPSATVWRMSGQPVAGPPTFHGNQTRNSTWAAWSAVSGRAGASDLTPGSVARVGDGASGSAAGTGSVRARSAGLV